MKTNISAVQLITPENTFRLVDGVPLVLAADASDLGMAPGVFPEVLNCRHDVGNEQPFHRTGEHRIGEDLDYVYYIQQFSGGNVQLRVYND